MKKNVWLATTNQGKITEFKALLNNKNIVVKSLQDLPKPYKSPIENGTTFVNNARIKALKLYQLVKEPVLADDSGLIIDALNGDPGIYSARFAGEKATDADNRQAVLTHMHHHDQRSARFVCALAFITGADEEYFYYATCEGTLAFKEQGAHGFGYDSLFIPCGLTQSFAEIDKKLKNTISHRAKAIQMLRQHEYFEGVKKDENTCNI